MTEQHEIESCQSGASKSIIDLADLPDISEFFEEVTRQFSELSRHFSNATTATVDSISSIMSGIDSDNIIFGSRNRKPVDRFDPDPSKSIPAANNQHTKGREIDPYDRGY